MNEIANEDAEFVEPGAPTYRSALPTAELPIHGWAAEAVIGWVPTTSLVPYGIVDSAYEFYDRLAFLLPGFILSIGLALFMSERTEKWYVLVGVLVVLSGIEVFFLWRFLDLRCQKEERWEKMMKEAKPVKVYTSFETIRSSQNEQ